MSLTIEHLIRVRSIYRTLRRERSQAFGMLPQNADFFLWRYLSPDAFRRMASCTFSDPPVVGVHPLAFTWENTLLLKGLIHHELCHLICGLEAGHGETFRNLEQGWDLYLPYTLQRNRFSTMLSQRAQTEGWAITYECPNCARQIIRKRPLRVGTACSVCCKAFNEGKWCEAYSFMKVDGLGCKHGSNSPSEDWQTPNEENDERNTVYSV
jgi:hypothetical protein